MFYLLNFYDDEYNKHLVFLVAVCRMMIPRIIGNAS